MMKKVFLTTIFFALSPNDSYWLTCDLDIPDEFILVYNPQSVSYDVVTRNWVSDRSQIASLFVGNHEGLNKQNDLWSNWTGSGISASFRDSLPNRHGWAGVLTPKYVSILGKSAFLQSIKDHCPDDLDFVLWHPEVLDGYYYPDGSEEVIITKGKV